MYHVIDQCRSCSGTELSPVLSLGDMPLADGFLTESALSQPEHRFPLSVVFCNDCSLMQLRETVDPEILFASDYPYYSSFSTGWVEHCRQNAEELIKSRCLGPQSKVIEVASNDGYMLRNFHEKGIPVLGIDPVPGPAAAAEALGIRTCREFFSLGLAESLAKEGEQADVLIGNNVLAHVADLSGFVNGIRTVLKPDGIAVIETPYVRDLIDHCEFDTIYHEHLCYFSVTSLSRLFNERDMGLVDVRRLPTHGGSLRIYASPGASNSASVQKMLDEERALGLTTFDYYSRFAESVTTLQTQLTKLLHQLAGEGKSVAAYGAAAKGTILLNSLEIEPDCLSYVVDRNVHKHGHFMPGLHTPICDPQRLGTEMPDYLLLLAWNHKAEIVQQQAAYQEAGGRFIVPIPQVTVL